MTDNTISSTDGVSRQKSCQNGAIEQALGSQNAYPAKNPATLAGSDSTELDMHSPEFLRIT